MNTIENLKSKYPNEWAEFIEWSKKHSEYYVEYNYNKIYSKAIERYLLADLQAWLDSVGVPVDGSAVIYQGHSDVAYWQPLVRNSSINRITIRLSTRPEALLSAIEKGMEIRKNSN